MGFLLSMIGKNPKTSWLDEAEPEIDPSATVHENAVVIGHVKIGKEVFVAPGAILRGDEADLIEIGDRSNVQDNVVIHGLKGSKVIVGKEVSIAHGAIIHGPAEIGDNTFVGFQSLIFKSKIGKNCFIGHKSAVIGVELKDNTFVPNGTIVDTQDLANSLPKVPEDLKEFNREVVKVNRELAKGYR